jgi:hypothetical protein
MTRADSDRLAVADASKVGTEGGPRTSKTTKTHAPREPSSSPDAEGLLMREFDQAWAHYRAADTMRTQFLGFVFTVTLGAAALSGGIASPDKLSQTLGFVAFAALLDIYLFLLAGVYLSIRKLDTVMRHYEQVFKGVRDYFYQNVDRTTEPYSTLNIRESDAPIMTGSVRRRLLRIQTVSEIVVTVFAAIATACEVALITYAASSASVAAVMTQSAFAVLASGSYVAVVLATGITLTDAARAPASG